MAAIWAADRDGARRRREELVEASALVGLEVREPYVPQLLERRHGGDGLAHQGEEPARPAEPLRRVHECAFGVLALESEPVAPRL
jgi:hypothetical protein